MTMTEDATKTMGPEAIQFRPKITVFHCINALPDTSSLENGDFEISDVKMPCSSIIREVFLLRAFEAGADAVVVLACPERQCRNVDGNVRAAKRVARIKKLLDDIGLDGQRLTIFNVPSGDEYAVKHIIDQTLSDLANLGPNPAA